MTHHRHRQAGEEHGGQQPVTGSHLYLFAVNPAGYGAPPISLLHGPGVSFDASNNGYVVTDGGGGFNITGLYASYCPTPGSPVYLQALGGDPGDGSDNPAIDLVTILPLTCAQLPTAPDVGINELTTIAAAWTLVRYASPSTSGILANGGNPQALLNAVTYANNLVSGYNAQVGSTAYGGSLTVPVTTINTMGDIIAECVNTGAASPACTQLFAYATTSGSAPPTDTFQAAIDIALNPANNATNLFYLVPGIGAPFEPTLSVAPLSWTITYGIPASDGAQVNSVTFNHTQVPNTDQINFPVEVAAPANPVLATASNGGKVQSPNGYDILFTSDAAGQNMLDFEIDNYSPATGAGTFWVRVPDLSHTTDTVIYMWYGIPNISNSLENALGVWSNNYLSVYHFGNGNSLGTMDSAVAGYNLLGTAAPVQGQIGGAAAFDGDPYVYLYHDNVTAYPSGTSPVTLETWVQQTNSVSDAFGYGANTVNGSRIALAFSNGQPVFDFEIMGILGSGNANGGWHSTAGVYGGGMIRTPPDQIYLDGVSQQLEFGQTIPAIATTELKIGGIPTVTFCCAFTGSVDEARISSGVRSADWIATEFNNQSAPNSFGIFSPALLFTSSTLLSSSADPTTVGQTVTLTAGVSGRPTIVPTGSVTFFDGTTSLGQAITVSSTGTATLSIATLSAGSHSITAVYSGDGNYLGSTSSVLTQTVTGPAPTFSCVPSTVNSGESVTCDLTLSAGAVSPVTFSISGATWTTATPNAAGNVVANAVLTEATPGSYLIVYFYPGDPGVQQSSGVASVTVNASGTQPSGTGIYSFSITDQNGNSGYAANSNINSYSDSVNGNWSLGYDSLNRLTSSANSPINASSLWGCWAYDSFGNTLSQAISTQQFSNATSCQAQSGAVTLQNTLHYNAANQIDPSPKDPSTWLDASKNTHTGSPSYDAAGNMTNDLLNTYLYNPQGQVCAVLAGGGYIGYLYDVEGHRVAKGTLPSLTCDPAALQITTIYFIGPDGGTMTEMNSATGWVRTEVSAAGQHLATYTPTGIHYPLTDWLGTKRVVVNPNLALNNGVEETCTSWPFGDQQVCSTSLDASPDHFTGKERDTESGNDYFGARYYGSNMGRWMSPDPSPAGVNVANPQSWNLYAYVLNNPLRLVDGNGMWATDVHAQIVTYSLQNYVSAGELNSLRARQYSMDADQSNQNNHAMANQGQSSQDALNSMWGIVSQDMSAVAVGKNSDGTLDNFGLYNLGGAMHTLEDFTSPMHTDSSFMPMEWDGGYWPPSKWGPGFTHVSGEAAPYQDWSRIGFAIRLTMAAWLQSGAPCEKGKQCLTEQNFNSEVEKNITSYVNDTYHGSQGSPIQEDMARQCALGNTAACNH